MIARNFVINNLFVKNSIIAIELEQRIL